jgi:hypothetical protein
MYCRFKSLITVGTPEKMKPRCRCGRRATVWRPLAESLTDCVQTMPSETIHASSNCFGGTRLCARNIQSKSLANVLLPDGHFCPRSRHPTICKVAVPFPRLLDGYRICNIHGHSVRVDVGGFRVLRPQKHYKGYSFSRVVFQQTLRRRCTPDTGEGGCLPSSSRSCSSVWQDNSLLREFVSQE